MTYFLLYYINEDDEGNTIEEGFIENLVCENRIEANKWANYLEDKNGGLYVPVRFINGKQVTQI